MRCFVLYHVTSEEIEYVDLVSDEISYNAFEMEVSTEEILLKDLQTAFPLGSNFHFSFQNEFGVYIDLLTPNATIPLLSNSKVIARATPLCRSIYMHCIHSRQIAPLAEYIP